MLHGSPLSLECRVDPDPGGFIRWNIVTASTGTVTLYRLTDKVSDVIKDQDEFYGREITLTNDHNGNYTLTFTSAERIRDDQSYSCEEETSRGSDAVAVHVYSKLSLNLLTADTE